MLLSNSSNPSDNQKPNIDNTVCGEKITQNNIEKLNIQQNAVETDVWIYRIIVSGLTSTVLGCLIGAIGLQISNKEIPQVLTALGTGSLGALSGLLAPSPVKK